jgi:hypothetical protein
MGILARRKEQGHMLLEDTIHLPEVHPLLRGTVDFGFWSMLDGIFLRDYKNGEGIGVSAPNNKQLLYYGFLMILKIMKEGHKLPLDMRVSLGIVQPNFYGVFEAPDVWETTVGFVLDWGNNELLKRMNSLMGHNIPTYIEDDFKPGTHCQFCPVLIDCPKMQQAFREYAEADEEFVAMLPDSELDRYYGMREQARRFMNALETTVHHRLVTGAKIPSAKLVEKKVARVWKPGAAAALQGGVRREGVHNARSQEPGTNREAVEPRQGIGARIRVQARERRPVRGAADRSPAGSEAAVECNGLRRPRAVARRGGFLMFPRWLRWLGTRRPTFGQKCPVLDTGRVESL